MLARRRGRQKSIPDQPEIFKKDVGVLYDFEQHEIDLQPGICRLSPKIL
jgi:hypothetical protein